MADGVGDRPPSRIDAVAEAVALIGGALLVGLATMVVVSVTLRSDLIGGAGVPGDFELVQMATAVAAFCFLPLCQLRRGNIFVDTFTLKLPQRWRDGLDALWDVVYGLAMALIAWRLGVGARSAFASGENTMVLQLPSYLPIAICAVLAGFVAVAAFVSASRLVRQPR
ncbi:hypothetical protein DK26_11935 [Bosea sp. WAO]|nr:hypothetical protein DK26_11935 [Bosea sp. WAO]